MPVIVLPTTATIVSTRNGSSTVTGASRDDLQVGDLVGLESYSNAITYAWSFVYKPAGSTATFSGSSTAKNPGDFTVDAVGSYLVKLVVDAGLETEDEQVVRLRRLSTLGQKLPGAGELKNNTNSVPVDVSPSGWTDDLNANLLLLESSIGGSGAQGFQGAKGFQGTTGAQGAQGFQGFKGFQGSTGIGVQGNQGYQGYQGGSGSIAYLPYTITFNVSAADPAGGFNRIADYQVAALDPSSVYLCDYAPISNLSTNIGSLSVNVASVAQNIAVSTPTVQRVSSLWGSWTSVLGPITSLSPLDGAFGVYPGPRAGFGSLVNFSPVICPTDSSGNLNLRAFVQFTSGTSGSFDLQIRIRKISA